MVMPHWRHDRIRSGYDIELFLGQDGLVPIFNQLLAALKREGKHRLDLHNESLNVPEPPRLRYVTIRSVKRARIVDAMGRDLELTLDVVLTAEPTLPTIQMNPPPARVVDELEDNMSGVRGLEPRKKTFDPKVLGLKLDTDITAGGSINVGLSQDDDGPSNSRSLEVVLFASFSLSQVITISTLRLAPHSFGQLNTIGAARCGIPLGAPVTAALSVWTGVTIPVGGITGLRNQRLHKLGEDEGRPGCVVLLADLSLPIGTPLPSEGSATKVKNALAQGDQLVLCVSNDGIDRVGKVVRQVVLDSPLHTLLDGILPNPTQITNLAPIDNPQPGALWFVSKWVYMTYQLERDPDYMGSSLVGGLRFSPEGKAKAIGANFFVYPRLDDDEQPVLSPNPEGDLDLEGGLWGTIWQAINTAACAVVPRRFSLTSSTAEGRTVDHGLAPRYTQILTTGFGFHLSIELDADDR